MNFLVALSLALLPTLHAAETKAKAKKEKPAVKAEAKGPEIFRLDAPKDVTPLQLEQAAMQRLSFLRQALSMYYGDHEGKYPPSLDALVPKYLRGLFEYKLPAHPLTHKVIVAKEAKGDNSQAYVTDSGAWLYITAPGNANGTVMFDCSHKDTQGKTLSEY
jgi:hypothetical protein